ncbi:MAG: BACON domain-containing protein, partial [Bacteroidales bacterium]|nr:BACON domain-containing protein [Bacteroidales bacterium]
SGPLPELGIDALEGNEITVWGYFLGFASSGKFISIMATEAALADPDAKFCNVSPASIKAKADETSASFTIKANAAWTISSDNADFTVSPASGEGDATVNVTFSANEGEEARVANITVTSVDAGVAAVVVLTQAKPSSGEATVIALDFTSEVPALPQAKKNGLVDATITLEGYDFIFHAAGKTDGEDNKFYQGLSSGKYYLLIGKKDAYIQLPVVEGKALTKIEFLTGAAASEKVVVDVAKSDGTPLNINTATLKQGQAYTWDIPGEVGVAYRLLITTAYNAQFQNLTLIYE